MEDDCPSWCGVLGIGICEACTKAYNESKKRVSEDSEQ